MSNKYKIGDVVEFFDNRVFYIKRKQGTILKIKGVIFRKYLIETNNSECTWIKRKNIYKIKIRKEGNKNMRKRNIKLTVLTLLIAITLIGCDESIASNGSKEDTKNNIEIANNLQQNQPTPTDINYSLERYNLIKRAYWVNGQRERAMSLPSAIERPLGYITLFTESGDVIGNFTVDGKVSSLNSYLTPDSEYYEKSGGNYSSKNNWLADIDGSYGENDNGVFFFTTDGKYIEWTGTYLYSDIPFKVNETILKEGE